MATLATTVDGLKFLNPFVIGSGPPGTNVKVIKRAFKEGWGGVIAKTVSLDPSKVVNVGPRYAKLMSADNKEVIGWENIELISDRSFDTWLDEFKAAKDEYPEGVLIASIMEEFNKDAWCEITERCQDAGVDAFELNFSCPHGLPERKMGAAMGQNPEVLEEVCGWVMGVSKLPVWAKMTPNITRIEEPTSAALRAGCHGVSAINTIRSVMGVNLETLRPEPTVEGYSTPGGYSSKAVKPIALRMCMEIATLIRKEFPGRTLSGMGGVETGADAAQFILLGSDTVQVCTGVMKFGYGMVKDLCEGLLSFMDGKGFETLDDFKGHSLQFFTTHAELVRMQLARKAEEAAAKERAGMVKSDAEWDGDDFVKQSNALSRQAPS
jgi:dihydropyrimidine dehydrogenase (NADP+)/dihydropyrimidine dehydrogenase (NAD+) subunit PreA